MRIVHNLFGFGEYLKGVCYAVLGLAYLRRLVFSLSGGSVFIFFGNLFHEAMEIPHVKGELYDYEGGFCFASDMDMLIMVFITEAYVDLVQGWSN